jgi:Reverse transcriptase (RNA-dependent DNA polymerase).
MLFNFALDYANWIAQANQWGLKLNSTYQFLIYADDGNLLGESIHTVQKSTEALLVTSKETGLDVNVKKTKYMFMFQKAGQSHDIQTGKKTFESGAQFKYLGTTLTSKFHS